MCGGEGLFFECAFEVVLCGVEVVGCELELAEGVEGECEVGVAAECGLEGGAGLVGAVEVVEGHAEVPVGGGDVGGEFSGALHSGEGGLEVDLFLEGGGGGFGFLGLEEAELELGEPAGGVFVGCVGPEGLEVLVDGGLVDGEDDEDCDDGGTGSDGPAGEEGCEEGDGADGGEVLEVVCDEGVSLGVDVEEAEGGDEGAEEEGAGDEGGFAPAVSEGEEGDEEGDCGDGEGPLPGCGGVEGPSGVDEGEVDGERELAEVEGDGAPCDQESVGWCEGPLGAGCADLGELEVGGDAGHECACDQQRDHGEDVALEVEGAASPPADEEPGCGEGGYDGLGGEGAGEEE